MAAAAGVQFGIGTFAIVARPPHYDEVYVVGHGPAPGELLTRTTTGGNSIARPAYISSHQC